MMVTDLIDLIESNNRKKKNNLKYIFPHDLRIFI
jgi:hypothetical protein